MSAAILLAALAATSCKDKEYFDKDVYNEIIGEAFPVTDIDPYHDWRTVTSGTTAISVGSDYTGNCTISVYFETPGADSRTLMVASGSVPPGGTLRTAFSYPAAQRVFYIAATGPDGLRVTRQGEILDGTLGASFSAAEAASMGSPAPDGQQEAPRFGIRYCFEDNFPLEGDYDFNDIVLTVTPAIEGSNVTLKVSLDAVGTTNQVAAALRIKGLSRSEIVSSAMEGDFDFNNGKPQSSFTIIGSKEYLLPDGTNHTGDVVINLFDDAHWALSHTVEADGSVRRWYYNTVRGSSPSDAGYADVSPTSVTYRFTLSSPEAAMKFVAENMDAFIINNSNGSYMETHTRPFKTSEVIFNYFDDPSAYDAPYIWALQLPGTFLYPLEGGMIGSDRKGVFSGAYQIPGHSFSEWATDRNTATDWYDYPQKRLVY